MKKAILIFYLFLHIFCLYAQNYRQYEMELVERFVSGDAISEFKTWFPIHEIGVNGPNGFCFTENGNIVFLDYLNNKIKIYSSEFEFIAQEDINIEPVLLNMYSDGNKIYVISNLQFFEYSEELKTSIHVKFTERQRFDEINYFLFKDVLFISTNGNISAISQPQPDPLDNENLLIEGDDLEPIFDEVAIESSNLPFLQGMNSFLINGSMVSRDFEEYYNYWYNISGIDSGDSYFTNEKIDLLNVTNYLGQDSFGNEYWKIGRYRILVLNDGRFIDAFEYDSSKSRIIPAIHPKGDVYFLSFDEVSIYLYKIPNTWAPFDWQPSTEDASNNPTAKVTASGLRMRDNPITTNSTVVASLNQGTIVEILGQSATEETIGGNTAYWFRIRTPEGLDGWVFGAFLEMQ